VLFDAVVINIVIIFISVMYVLSLKLQQNFLGGGVTLSGSSDVKWDDNSLQSSLHVYGQENSIYGHLKSKSYNLQLYALKCLCFAMLHSAHVNVRSSNVIKLTEFDKR